jgi:hypothetical protein
MPQQDQEAATSPIVEPIPVVLKLPVRTTREIAAG